MEWHIYVGMTSGAASQQGGERQGHKMREKYPDKVPIFLRKAEKSKLDEIEKHKWLAPADMTVGAWMTILRRHIQVRSSQAIFLMIHGIVPRNSATLEHLYDEHMDNDGLLRMTYCEMATFG